MNGPASTDPRESLGSARHGARRPSADDRPDGLRDQSDRSDRSAAAWPERPATVAYHGLAGRIVEAIDPHTEGDPVAVLGQTLVLFGSVIGPEPHAMVGATRHGTNTNVMVVGDTAKARKGDSFSPVRRIFELADPDYCARRIHSGFGSGEGVIWAVRDPTTRLEPVREGGRVTRYETVVADEGENDKRLLVVEPELARILRVAGRQGSILSMIMRDAWDGGDLAVITKGTHLRATGAHVSTVGHITADELRRELSDSEAANGFMNRWLVMVARRSKLLPEPEPFEGRPVQLVADELRNRIAFARAQGRIERSQPARELWGAIYADLSRAHPGLVGAMLARAEAHVLRLAILYALLDRSVVVEPVHLQAAVEVWGYAERSVRFLFGEATGNPLADRILRALGQADELTRTEIRDLLGRHASEPQVDVALGVLLEAGLARVEPRATGGRPVEVWQRA
jgi:hypothetical protein